MATKSVRFCEDGNRLLLKVPYNRDFIAQAKIIEGQYVNKFWVFQLYQKASVTDLCERIFGGKGYGEVTYKLVPPKRGFWFFFLLITTIVAPFFGGNGWWIAIMSGTLTWLLNKPSQIPQYPFRTASAPVPEADEPYNKDFDDYMSGDRNNAYGLMMQHNREDTEREL